MKSVLVVLLFAVVVLSGCHQEQSMPDYTEFNQEHAQYRFLPSKVAEEEIALDIVEDRISGESTMATTDEPTSEGIVVEDIEEVTGFSKWVLEYRAWLFFIAYVLVMLIAVWYTKCTGKESETLTKISSALDERMSFKQRVLYRFLKKWLDKKAKK